MPYQDIDISRRRKKNKTGVINDPLGQPTVTAGSDFRLILQVWDVQKDVRTNGRTTCAKTMINTNPDSGSVKWINISAFFGEPIFEFIDEGRGLSARKFSRILNPKLAFCSKNTETTLCSYISKPTC